MSDAGESYRPYGRFSSDVAPDTGRERTTHSLPFLLLVEYFELIDWTGRAQSDDKRGAIEFRLPPIIKRAIIEASVWQTRHKGGQIRTDLFSS